MGNGWKFVEFSDLENKMYMKPPLHTVVVSDMREKKKFLTMNVLRCWGHSKGSLGINFKYIKH